MLRDLFLHTECLPNVLCGEIQSFPSDWSSLGVRLLTLYKWLFPLFISTVFAVCVGTIGRLSLLKRIGDGLDLSLAWPIVAIVVVVAAAGGKSETRGGGNLLLHRKEQCTVVHVQRWVSEDRDRRT